VSLLLLTTLGCEVNSLQQPWLVDRTRILGVRAEPAEPAPGDMVFLSSLTADPENGIDAVTWFGCVYEESSSVGCELDTEALEELLAQDPESMTPQQQAEWYEALQATGFLGVEPDLPPRFRVPPDLLDDLSGDALDEGKNYIFNLNAIPGGLDFEELDINDQNQLEAGLKRMPVSLSENPNTNPTVVGLKVEGQDDWIVVDGDTLRLGAGQRYAFELLLADDAVQSYSYVNSSGETEDRVEEPYMSLYTTTGEFDQNIGLHPYFDFEYTAPTDPSADGDTLWAVVRDRRGGFGWLTIQLEFE
jgi:hypothetical protein